MSLLSCLFLWVKIIEFKNFKKGVTMMIISVRKIIKKESQSWVALFVCFTFMLAGCGGRAANPIMVSQFGDSRKSCESLQLGMSQVQQEIARLVPDTEKTGTNTALAVTGLFLVVPLFFMDFTESERIEVNAYRNRYNHLAMIATDKNCGYDTTPIQSFEKPKKEMKKDVFGDEVEK